MQAGISDYECLIAQRRYRTIPIPEISKSEPGGHFRRCVSTGVGAGGTECGGGCRWVCTRVHGGCTCIYMGACTGTYTGAYTGMFLSLFWPWPSLGPGRTRVQTLTRIWQNMAKSGQMWLKHANMAKSGQEHSIWPLNSTVSGHN